MTLQRIVGALFVDMESAPPRARYEYLLCGTREGPVVGRGPVTAFVADVRINHRSTCQAVHPNQRKAA